MPEDNFYDFLINKALETKDFEWVKKLYDNKQNNKEQNINVDYNKYIPCLKELYNKYIEDNNIQFIGLLFDLIPSTEGMFYKLIPKFHSIIPFSDETTMNVYKDHTKDCSSIIGFFLSKEEMIEFNMFNN
jgi:hypothetical protein